MRALVVDDDPIVVAAGTRMLNSAATDDIVPAQSGTEALKVYDDSKAPFDLILCDLQMPDMDGVELLRHLAERDCRAGIVLVSGEDKRVLSTAESLAQAHGLNVLGALSKPLKRQALQELLDRLAPIAARRAQGPEQSVDVEDLRKAIGSDELTVFFQPKVSTKNRAVEGVEALVRWQHPTRGVIGPDYFIPLAEKSGLINEMTDVIFRKAFEWGGEWKAAGIDIKVSVNISVDSLDRLDLPDVIVQTARNAGLPPESVILEVTESRLMADILKPLEILTRLRMKSVALSIDDFGTGYSSLEQLKRIPFSELKIDRAFVNGACKDAAARAILESSAALARRLEMNVVAEGVETQEDWDLVASLGVHLVQGYFVAKPMSGGDIQKWYASWVGSAPR